MNRYKNIAICGLRYGKTKNGAEQIKKYIEENNLKNVKLVVCDSESKIKLDKVNKKLEEVNTFIKGVIESQNDEVKYLKDICECPINGSRIFKDKFNEIHDKEIILKIYKMFSNEILSIIERNE